MKKILVPTDFSEAAEHAACYGLHLAISLKADIELVYAMKVPAEAPMAPQVAWPLEDYPEVRNEAYFGLKALSAKLKADEIDISLHDHQAYEPEITETAEVGNVTDIVRNVCAAHDTQLVVMGMSGAGSINRLLLGSNSKSLIDKAEFRVLLIPRNCVYQRLEKIAFATSLSEADIETINQLAAFAAAFNAEILLIYITDEKYDKVAHQKKIDSFLNDITCKINYPKIYYRHIKSRDVDAGLEWLSGHGRIDMLAMVHRKPSILSNLFEASHTQRMARRIHLPLLVFPGPDRPVSIPIF